MKYPHEDRKIYKIIIELMNKHKDITAKNILNVLSSFKRLYGSKDTNTEIKYIVKKKQIFNYKTPNLLKEVYYLKDTEEIISKVVLQLEFLVSIGFLSKHQIENAKPYAFYPYDTLIYKKIKNELDQIWNILYKPTPKML